MVEVIPQFISTMKESLRNSEYKCLTQAVNETPQRSIRFPIPRKLRISNLNLFNRDYELNLENGLNIVYGGNRNGKTTVANSIEFGLFGIFQHTHSYFASRIANPDKPVRIDVEVSLGKATGTIRREISNASASHKAKLTFFGEPLYDSGPSIEGPVDVQEELQRRMGCSIWEARELYDAFYLREVPRNYHLSSRIGDNAGSEVRRRILYRLIDSDRFNRIIGYCESKRDELRRNILLDNNELTQLTSESDAQKDSRIDKVKRDLKYVSDKYSELNEQKKIILEDMNALIRTTRPDADTTEIQIELATITTAAAARTKGYERLRSATILPSEKMICETCGQEYTQEARERISNEKCFACGSSVSGKQLIQIEADLQELRKQEQNAKKKSDLKFLEIEQSAGQIQQLQKKLEEVMAEQERLNGMKLELESELVRSTSHAGKERINQLTTSISEQKEKGVIWNNVLAKTLEYVSTHSSDVMNDLNKRFLAHTSEVIQGSNGFALDKSLNIVDDVGGPVSFDYLSHAEKNLLEIAYRLSVIEIALQKKTIDEGFLILETPEEALDITYRDNLAKILSATKGMKILVTTSDQSTITKLKPWRSVISDLVKVSTFVSKQQEKQLKLTEF